MPKHRHECDAHVHARTKTDPRYRHIEDRVIDIEKEHGKACEEEEKREVQQRGQRFDRPRETKVIDTLSKERANSRSLVWTVSCLDESHVATRPLLE
jgi:hypothetical protein